MNWIWGGARRCIAGRKDKKTWQARVKLHGDTIDTYIGVSRTDREAAIMRDNFIRQLVLKGKLSKLSETLRQLNFPTEAELRSGEFTKRKTKSPNEEVDGNPPDQGLQPDLAPDEQRDDNPRQRLDRVEIECNFHGNVRRLVLGVGESCDLNMLRQRVQQLYPDLAQRRSGQAFRMVLRYALSDREMDFVPLDNEEVWLTVCSNIGQDDHPRVVVILQHTTQCGICLEPKGDHAIAQLQCKHSFCFGCIENWGASGSAAVSTRNIVRATCPLCRIEVSVPVPKNPVWCVPGAIAHGSNDKVGRVSTGPDTNNRVTVEWIINGRIRREKIDSRR